MEGAELDRISSLHLTSCDIQPTEKIIMNELNYECCRRVYTSSSGVHPRQRQYKNQMRTSYECGCVILLLLNAWKILRDHIRLYAGS